MIILVLGLLLLVFAVVLIVVAVAGGGDSVVFEVFGLDVEIWAWAFFGAGVVTTLLALGGAIALRAGIQELGLRRKEVDFLRQRVAELEDARPQSAAVEGSAAKGKNSAGESSASKGKSKSSAGNVPATSD